MYHLQVFGHPQEVTQEQLDHDLLLLPQWRREKALAYHFLIDQVLCAKAYLLLKQGLKTRYGIEDNPRFGYVMHEKPVLTDYPHIHFNLSHSGTVALCAISDQPVGADVEVPRKISPDLICYTMSDEEQQQINTSPDPIMQFLYFWTRKEAFLKLSSKGIRNDMRRVLAESGDCHLETIQTDHYIYSIANYK